MMSQQPGHVRIALTSNSLTSVDSGFSSTKQILFYDVTYDQAEFLDIVQFKNGRATTKGPGGGQGGAGCWMSEEMAADEVKDGVDPLTARIESLQGCGVLFTKSLSEPAAVRVYAMKVFPVKMERKRDIDDVIASLQQQMAMKRPPLWLRKAMGTHIRDAAYQVFDEDEAEAETTLASAEHQ